jgi:sn-glycerol 3-phosphate transport system ATP-binding protein
MASIELRNITKRWGQDVAVSDVSFQVDKGSFVILLGPSGCGKSTTLRMIAGLEEVSSGNLFIDGQNLTNAPPAKRNLSMVFQSYALFPHLSVSENILFGLKVRKVSIGEQLSRLERVSEIVGLSDLLDRKPAQLSGGQRQRVALARAIIAENPICLMDEPLSNLDAKLRQEMRTEIRSLQQRLGMTVVYVTHDQSEAMSMGDKVILLRDGRVVQEGTPDALYDCPSNAFAAAFIGTPPMNLLHIEQSPDGWVLEGTTRSLQINQYSDAKKLLFGVRPEHVELVESGGLEVELLAADYLGSETIVSAQLGNQTLFVEVKGHFSFSQRQKALVAWPDDKVHLFEVESGDRLEG